MAQHPIFLSIVLVLKNQAQHLQSLLEEVQHHIDALVSDYEIIVVDNASEDESIAILKNLTSEEGLPNLQIYALTKEVDVDTASWVGLESALGDYVAVYDPFTEEFSILSEMLDKAVEGADVVFAHNSAQDSHSFVYKSAQRVFHQLYRSCNGIDLQQAPHYRILSRVVINFILQHPQPALTYRHLPASGGFVRARVHYNTPPKSKQPKKLWEAIDRGTQLRFRRYRVPYFFVGA